jgi:hypothetical protein
MVGVFSMNSTVRIAPSAAQRATDPSLEKLSRVETGSANAVN